MKLPRGCYSLSGRLVALFLAMAVVFIVLVGSSIGSAFRAHFKDSIRPHLLRYLEYVQADIGNPPDPARTLALSKELPVEIHILDDTGSWSSNGVPFTMEDAHLHPWRTHNHYNYTFGVIDNREYIFARFPTYTLAFSVSRAHEHFKWRVLPIAVMLLILIALYYATQRLFSPINAIKKGVERLGNGELGVRLNIKRRDELGELGHSINAMAEDIEQLLEAKRQLLLAISHELRTPLTRAKVATAMITDNSQRLEIQQDLDEMNQLIEELLETERLSTRHRALNRSTFSLTKLMKDVVSNSFPNSRVTLTVPESDIIAYLDEPRIRLLLKNLLENAIRHTEAHNAPPALRADVNADDIVITIIDFGKGVAPEHLPHITKPFYRVDPSRRRETGGYGLGLYLCRMIAEAHQGTLTIASEINRGTQLTITLPRNAAMLIDAKSHAT